MKRCAAVLLVFLLLAAVPAAAQTKAPSPASTPAPAASRAAFKKTKIAVLDFTLQGQGFETEDMGAIVAEWFITAFVKAGRFDVVERSMISKILEEQKLTMSGILDDSTATEIGKLLGVETIISGSVLKLQNVLEINARIIDVETASIKAAENVKSTAAIRLQDLVVQMSEQIIKNFPLEGYIVSRAEKNVSLDLGRSAGARAGMEFIVYKEGQVIRHPKTGEVLDVEQIQTGRVVLRKILDKLSQGEIVEETEPGAVAYGQMVYSASAAVRTPPPAETFVGTEPAAGGKAFLYVDPEPSSATVRILNIGPRYHPGIALSPGNYHIEVSSPGHHTSRQWVAVADGENKRIRVPLEKAPAALPSADAPAPVARVESAPAVAPEPKPQAGSDLPAEARQYVQMLRSGNAEKIVFGSKKIVRMQSVPSAVYEAAESVLLSGYRSNASDRHYADAMAWLCNVLGASGKSRYRSTLQTVAAGAPNDKLKKYALKNLKNLQ